MRIAYLSADYGVPVLGGKGGSVHIQQLVSAFAGLGHEVTLYCTRLGNGDPRRIDARIVEVARPADTRPFSVVDGEDAAAGERQAKERGWMARAAALADLVIADHRERPFDMIYERYSLWSRAGVRAARQCGIPVVVEVNAPLVEEAAAYRELASKADADAIEAEVLSGASAIVAVSDGVAAYAASRGAEPARIHVVPNAVDATMFDPAVVPACLPALDGKAVIGFVGGLKPWHGLQELCGAFRRVSDRHPDARLLIAGDGPMRGWIEGYLAGSGLGARAVVTGWVAHEALPALVARMDIATAPYPALDGFYFSPLKLFEYMASGRAIVASRIGQIDGIIGDGENGLLVPPGDVDQLAAALDRLLSDAALRQRLGTRAAQTASGYTWSENARRIVDIASVAADGGKATGRRVETAPRRAAL